MVFNNNNKIFKYENYFFDLNLKLTIQLFSKGNLYDGL